MFLVVGFRNVLPLERKTDDRNKLKHTFSIKQLGLLKQINEQW